MQTTSFKISRYILLVLVLVLCIGIIAWTIVTRNKPSQESNAPVDNVIRITNSDSCVQEVTNTISRLWAYDADKVPQKYVDMINTYANERITTRTTGYCNDIKFTCKAGQLRKDCDPCAIGSARQFAMDQQIVDTIAKECQKTAKN